MGKRFFDRNKIQFHPLSGRKNEVEITKEYIKPSDIPVKLSEDVLYVIKQTAKDILEAKNKGTSRILTFGTHLIHNGLGPLVGEFINRGWLTHLATTGTSVVDDLEFAIQGAGCENIRENLSQGTFGTWQETGYYINLALLVGAWEGRGMGESVGRMITDEVLEIPERDTLSECIKKAEKPDQVAAAADLLNKLEEYNIPSGRMDVITPFRKYSLQYLAWKRAVPFTVHPMFGLDTLFMHPINSFSAVGRCAEKDFLRFVASVENMEDGLYISVGSSITSPMIYEKALSMSQNVRISEGRRMERHKIVVVDLAKSKWNWMVNGEPSEDRPEYYLRYCKSFSRAKAKTMYYVSADNRDFFLHLYRELNRMDTD